MKKTEKPLKKGTTICSVKPFAHVLCSKYKDNHCDYCLKSGNLLKCSACQCVYYCNRSCQRASWSLHTAECANLKRVSPKVVPDMARLMARIIIKLNQGGGEEVEYYNERNYRKFKDLMSHYTDIKKDNKKMAHFMSLCCVLSEFLKDVPMPNYAELMGIYGRISINSFMIYDVQINNIGIGLYLGPSIVDHSCKPNSAVIFEGTTLIIRTIEDLPCLDWSQITISYIDILETEWDRCKALESAYYFWCDCIKCENPEPTANAAMCPNKSCTYPCSPDTDTCKKCNTTFPEKFKEIFDDVSELTAHHLQEMKNVAYLDVSKMCLKKQEGVLHPLNVQHVQTLRCAHDSAMNLKHWEEAEFYAKKLVNGYLVYYGEIHQMTGLLYLTIGKIQLYLNKPKQALEMLKKATSVLTITHGEQHSLLREHLKPLHYQATMETQ